MPSVGHSSNDLNAGYKGSQDTSRTATPPEVYSLAEGWGAQGDD